MFKLWRGSRVFTYIYLQSREQEGRSVNTARGEDRSGHFGEGSNHVNTGIKTTTEYC